MDRHLDFVRSKKLPLTEMTKGLRLLYDYWTDLKGDLDIPRKADLRPEELPFLLGAINIIEVRRDPLDFIVRLNGTTIVELQKQELTGRSVRAATPKIYADEVFRHYQEAESTVLPSLYAIMVQRSLIKSAYVRLVLPLSKDGAQVDYLMTASEWDKNYGWIFGDRPDYRVS